MIERRRVPRKGDYWVDWEAVAKRLGYETELAMWTDLYITKRLSISELAARFDVSSGTVRPALHRCKIAVRPRGGANNRQQISYAGLAEEVKKVGIVVVAARLGLTSRGVYYRIRAQRKREAKGEGIS